MRGVGSHNHDWAYCASPSSNLSAFAAPFSVARSSSNDVSAPPFLDSAESAAVQPRSYGYDFFSSPIRELDSTPPSKPYGYSVIEPSSGVQLPQFNSLGLGLAPMNSFSYDQCSNNSAKPSLVEAPYYYPSYITSPIHDPSPSVGPNHWPSLSSGFTSLDRSTLDNYAKNSPAVGITGQSAGLWNQFAELNSVKSMEVGVGSSFSSNQTNVAGSVVEERMNQGCQDVNDSINGEVTHMIGWEKQCAPVSADQLDGKSCWWGTIKPMTVEFSGTSYMGSPSVSLETHHGDPQKVADSGNSHLSHTGSYDKYSRQQCDKPLRVDTTSSTPITVPVMDLNIGNITEDGDLGNRNFYNVKEAYQRPISGTGGCFDLSHLRMHLERDEPSSSNNAMDKNVSRDVVDYIFKEMNGIQDPHVNLDKLSLRLRANEDFNSVEKSFDGADRCNPAVDSPCWKGAPAARYSDYEAYEAKPPEYVHKNEKCFGSVIQEPQSFLLDKDNNVKKSCKNSSNYQILNEIAHQETKLAGSPRKFAVAKFASENCNSDNAVNTSPFQSEPSCDSGLKYLNDITEMKENNVPPAKPIYAFDSGSSHTEPHVTEENKLMLHKPHTLCTDGADAESNVNNGLECGVSHMAKHALSSTSVVDAPNTLEKSAGKVSTPKLNVQMMVDTMHNLSELLLFHCLNDACELKEQDCNVLENVISNLNTCALKNAERITPSQECLFPQPGTSRHARESCKLQQNASFAKHQLTQVGLESPKVELENPLVKEAKNLHFKSGKLVQQLSDSISPRGDEEIKSEDNMTKALKRILSENFHDDEEAESQTALYKNLWLEAEATLCSIYYKARYNQMKIEIEKHKQKDMDEHSSLSRSQSSATKVHVDPNPDSSGPDSPVLNATDVEDLSGLKFSADMNKSNALTSEGKSSQHPDTFVQNSTVSSTNKDVEDDEASVLARFHVLKARVDKSCMNTGNLEELSDITVKLPPRGIDSQDQVNFCRGSPLPGKNKADDLESSVMARFHILRSRVEGEDWSFTSSEGKFLDGFAGKGMDDTIISTKASKGDSLDVHVNPSVVYLSSYDAVDKSIPRELHLDLEDHEEIQPCGTYEFGNGNQLPTNGLALDWPTDGLALDWEHVEKSL